MTAARGHTIFAGTSGWSYSSWKPGFYPQTVSAAEMLAHYSSRLNSVEVNYTFRKLPTAAQVAGWLAQTGEDFRFSFKAPQRVTHFSRLRDCEQHLADFYDVLRPVARAGKLGLVLFQLPPNFKANVPLLRDFLASRQMRRKDCPRVAFEFRHPSWFGEETENVLRRFNAAFCIAQTDELQTPEVHTAVSHTCFRLRQGGGYADGEISTLATQLTQLVREREVFAYFRHEAEPTGALNATDLLGRTAALQAAHASAAEDLR